MTNAVCVLSMTFDVEDLRTIGDGVTLKGDCATCAVKYCGGTFKKFLIKLSTVACCA